MEPIILIIFIASTISYIFGLYLLGRGLEKISYPFEAGKPAISVIVSLHNEEKNITDLLTHLSRQDYPHNRIEIILVDDRSEDNTLKMLREFQSSSFPVRVIEIRSTPDNYSPKKYALHRAISEATGEILLFTDADGRPGPGWASALTSCFTSTTGMVIGYAPYYFSDRKNVLINKLFALEYLSHAAIAAATAGLGYPVTCVGTNMAFRRSVYEQLDGYGQYSNIHSGDDDLFLQRVREETGWEIRYSAPDSGHVKNAPPDTWQQFYNQRIRYASKSPLYPKKFQIALILFYLYYLLLSASLIISLFNHVFLPFFVVGLAGKLISDHIFLTKAGHVLHDTRYTRLTVIAQILHIPYVLYFGAAAQLSNYHWGGRKGRI